MQLTETVMSDIAELTLQWSRKFLYLFPRWEIDELRNEAFLVSIQLLERGRFKKDKGTLPTFLWNALRLDVGHRYKRANAQRYLTCEDGIRRYQQKELSQCNLTEAQQYEYEKKNTVDEAPLSFIDVKVNHNEWSSKRIEGFTARELQREGMSLQEQQIQAQEFRSSYDEQQSKRSEG